MRAAIRKVISLDFARSTGSCLLEKVPVGEPTAELEGVALLVTRDSLSVQWAPRWLQQVGLHVEIASDAKEALEIAAAKRPTVFIIDAAEKDDETRPLLQRLRRAHGAHVPTIALCTSDEDVTVAATLDATDIVRRPYQWDLITRRVVKAVNASDTLRELRKANAKLDKINSRVTEAEVARAKSIGMDALTCLPSIEKFRSLLHKATTGRGAGDRDLCLLAIGLDRFRVINEAIGYENANALLSQFADRLRNCLRDRNVIGDVDSGSVTAIAARLGGARFGLLVSHGDVEQIRRVNQAIIRQLSEPFEVAGQSIYLTASVGAAIHPRDCRNMDDLLHFAENAMFRAQDNGSGFEFYTDLDDTGSHRLFALDGMLREAIRNGDLELAYQPITDVASGKVVAAEALLRWEHAEQGPISPAVFVPAAESSGLMAEIGDFVIEKACRQLGNWIAAGMQPIRIAVNLSLCQLLRGDVVKTVDDALNKNGLTPELLELELSERGVLNRNPEVVDVVRRLKALGVRISIDDFGTGNAAIGYLKDLPIDVIKIDRSYISGKDRNERDEAIASGIVALAQRLDATVIAEGVETEAQLEMLRDWGSQECQGFYFSPAIDGDEFRARFSHKARF